MFRVPGDEVLILRLDRDDVTVEIRCTYTLLPGGKGRTHRSSLVGQVAYKTDPITSTAFVPH